MDCKVFLDSKKILVDRDELNFNSLPISLFDENSQIYKFKENNIKYLSEEIELLVSKTSNSIYII